MAEHEEIEDFLEHFGVKGMRWGVRKPRSSNADIIQARKNQARRKRAGNKEARAGNATEAQKLKDEYNTHPDKAVAELHTTGEKVGSVATYAALHPFQTLAAAAVARSVYLHRGEIAGTAVIAGKIGSYLVKQAFASKDSEVSSQMALGRQVVQGFVVHG
jgi:hypothetical protein